MSKVYEVVRNKLIDRLEKAIKGEEEFHWIKPWSSSFVPRNFISKKRYRGTNLLLLDEPGFYVTFKQLTELQKIYPFLKLKKGCKKHMVVFWQFKGKENENDDLETDLYKNTETGPIFRYYNVYNQKDIEGFEEIIPDEYKQNNSELPNLKATRLCNEWSRIVNIYDVDIDRAFYSPSLDLIKVPPIECYEDANLYFGVKFHEIIHSTGHKDRLNRFVEKSYFGNTPYSKEELVAEIGSQMLMAECGLESDKITNNSVAYLRSWIKNLKDDILLVTVAAQKAQKACDYIFEETKFLEKEIRNNKEEIA